MTRKIVPQINVYDKYLKPLVLVVPMTCFKVSTIPGVIFLRENARFSRYFQNSRAEIFGARAILALFQNFRAGIFRAQDFLRQYI